MKNKAPNDINITIKEKIRIFYPANIGMFLLIFICSLIIFFIFLVVLYPNSRIIQIFKDWRLSESYTVSDDDYVTYYCYKNNNILICKIEYYIVDGKRTYGDNNDFTLKWFNLLTPDNFKYEGSSLVARSVDNPEVFRPLFALETLSIRFISYTLEALVLLLFACFCLYINIRWWRIFYWRCKPNHVSLKVVKVVYVQKLIWNAKGYHCIGLPPPHWRSLMGGAVQLNAIPLMLQALKSPVATSISNKLEPIFIDTNKEIGIAIHPLESDGGILLDRELSRLDLSQDKKAELLAKLNTYHKYLYENPEEFNKLVHFFNSLQCDI